MSLLSTECLSVFLSPAEVLTVRWRGLPRQIVEKQRYTVGPREDHDWAWVAETFADILRKGPCQRLRVILSSHFTRYLLVPWRDDLKDREEELAVVRREFSRTYGGEASHWAIRLSDEAPGLTRVAAAIDGAFLDAIEQAAHSARARDVSIQPYLTAAANRWHGHFGQGQSKWLVLLEDKRACLAWIEDTRWRWVRSVRVGADWMEHLPELVGHEILLAGADAMPQEVLVFAPDTLFIPAGSPLPFRSLNLEARKGFSPESDGHFGLALVG